jgi:hypothetical protein
MAATASLARRHWPVASKTWMPQEAAATISSSNAGDRAGFSPPAAGSLADDSFMNAYYYPKQPTRFRPDLQSNNKRLFPGNWFY